MGLYKVTWRAKHSNGALIEPGLHYRTEGLGIHPDATPNELADEVASHLLTAFRACCTSSITVDALDVRECVLPPAIPAVGSHNCGGVVGTFTSGTVDLPRALTGVIKLKSSAAIRSGRGWHFMPSPGITSALSGGVWAAGVVVPQWQTYADLLNDVITHTVSTVDLWKATPCVYSLTRHKRGTSPFTFDLDAALVTNTPHWLSSRLSAP